MPLACGSTVRRRSRHADEVGAGAPPINGRGAMSGSMAAAAPAHRTSPRRSIPELIWMRPMPRRWAMTEPDRPTPRISLAAVRPAATGRPGRSSYGLEGDFDYFHSNSNFYNNTDTLRDRRQLPSSSGNRSPPITWRPCVRASASPRTAISLTSPAASPSPTRATRRATSDGAAPASASQPPRNSSRVGPQAPAGNMPGPTIGLFKVRISVRGFPDDQRDRRDHRARGGSQSAPRLRGSAYAGRPRSA